MPIFHQSLSEYLVQSSWKLHIRGFHIGRFLARDLDLLTL
jgi:hypothetical protein